MESTAMLTIFFTLASLDCYLFSLLLTLQNFLDNKTFASNEDFNNNLDQFFESKSKKFYEHGIMILPERLQHHISNFRDKNINTELDLLISINIIKLIKN